MDTCRKATARPPHPRLADGGRANELEPVVLVLLVIYCLSILGAIGALVTGQL